MICLILNLADKIYCPFLFYISQEDDVNFAQFYVDYIMYNKRYTCASILIYGKELTLAPLIGILV